MTNSFVEGDLEEFRANSISVDNQRKEEVTFLISLRSLTIARRLGLHIVIPQSFVALVKIKRRSKSIVQLLKSASLCSSGQMSFVLVTNLIFGHLRLQIKQTNISSTPK